MGKNTKNTKKARNEEAVKVIKEKQSRKKKEQKGLKKIKNIRQKEKEERKEERRKARESAKIQAKQSVIDGEIKTKEQERKAFIELIGKAGWYAKRVDAEIADQKRKEEYLKYVNDEYKPKLEQKVYRSKQTEGKGGR